MTVPQQRVFSELAFSSQLLQSKSLPDERVDSVDVVGLLGAVLIRWEPGTNTAKLFWPLLMPL